MIYYIVLLRKFENIILSKKEERQNKQTNTLFKARSRGKLNENKEAIDANSKANREETKKNM